MIKYIIVPLIILWSPLLVGQTTVSGSVKDVKNMPIPGANVYLEGTYDGASTDNKGNFVFETNETGSLGLTISMMGYEAFTTAGDIGYFKDLKVTLLEAINTLSGVTLSAGTFEAGGNSKASVLKPLDIVTTAGAVATIPPTTSFPNLFLHF